MVKCLPICRHLTLANHITGPDIVPAIPLQNQTITTRNDAQTEESSSVVLVDPTDSSDQRPITPAARLYVATPNPLLKPDSRSS